jgi:ABC-2 type transport system permease protein
MMQTPTFLILFMAPVYVPLALLTGWIHAVASVNPATALLNAGRGLISGGPGDVALGFACAVGLAIAFAMWAVRGLRSAERAG